jgi:hypothetical protein
VPKRKRSREDANGDGAQPEAAVPKVDPQVALFAQRHQEELDRQKAEQRAAAERRKREAEHQRLVAAKDDAVARVKALRRRDRVPAGETATADTAYKASLAALIEFETGEPPTWAASGAAAPDVDDQPEAGPPPEEV